MELRKKSILIALCIGNGCISKQIKRDRTYNYLEISHRQHQGEYIQWKANLCTSVTGRKSKVRRKKYKAKKINGVPESLGYTFVNTSPYFRILRKWLYPNNKKKLSKKMISYLDELGLAIWYMDDGCTYVSKIGKTFTAEISTHIPENDAQELIDLFKEKWNITFYLHKKGKNQFNIRAYSSNALKFLKLIEPFVPDCMAYKLIVPKFYFQECTASHLKRIEGMKIYSEQQ